MINLQESFALPPTVSFDVFDTLTLPQFDKENQIWKPSWLPNHKILAELFRFASTGWNIYLITDVENTPKNKRELEWFLIQNQLQDVVNGRIIYCTGLESKAKILKGLPNLKFHYDDDPFELEALPDGVTGIKIYHPTNEAVKKRIKESHEQSSA